jgi:hypothetical protein
MPMNTANESTRYRLLIPRRSGSELLLLTEQHGLALPSVDVPQRERIAPHVTKNLKERWGIEAVCLFTPALSPLRFFSIRYQVAELCRPNDTLPEGFSWFPLESLPEASFAEAEELGRIRSAMDEFQSYANGSTPGTFAKSGWLREVLDWVDSELGVHGLHTTGQFRQLNASPTFSLLRIETTGPAVWFKAVGQPNLREYPITLALTKSFPAFLPTVIADRRDWNAWLATEAQGTHPDANSDFNAWLKITTSLADLQIASLGQALHLIDAGCQDVRVRTLRDQVHPFLEMMAKLMEQQTKETPAPLKKEELHALETQLQEALSNLEDSGIPNALGHFDLNAGNAVVSGNRCVFLDWAEAHVGHPLLTFQYLLEHLRRLCPAKASWECKLLSAYLAKWQFLLEPDGLSRTVAVVPLLAAFAFAVGVDAWREEIYPRRSETVPLLRSLARRMKREADCWTALQGERRNPCFS